MSKLQQLSLNLCLRDDLTFNNYFATKNLKIIQLLHEVLAEPKDQFVYLWGNNGVGKTHILTACCNYCGMLQQAALYLPLREHANFNPAALLDTEYLRLVCLDDLEAVIGKREWEEAIFNCFNRLQASGKTLMVTANAAPEGLPFLLPDLKSRMLSNLIMQLQPLDDDEKLETLKLRANLRGLVLSDNVAKFLLHHYARDTESLFASLDILDKASLQEQRKLTIPFIKKQLKINASIQPLDK